jgi:hypothetical protein
MTLFPLDEKSKLPVTLYAGLAPSNPHASVSWFRALDLANRGMLAHALINEGLMEFDPEDKWFIAVKALEERGIRRGVTPAEVAEVLQCAPSTARRHMLKGEEFLYAVFGLNVIFSGHGFWRIATNTETAKKYELMASELRGKYRRMAMYRPHVAALEGHRKPVQLELLVAVRQPRKGKKAGAHEAAD